jgi:hypothetical protein
MLTTQTTNFCIKQTLGGQKITLELDCGDLLIFKGDLVHSGGASLVTNFRFFSYCPTQATSPVWWNKHRDQKDILSATLKLSEKRVGSLNLRIVSNPQSCQFRLEVYKKYLFCGKTNSFFPFDMSAFFHGIHTHKEADSVAYNGIFEDLKSIGTAYKTPSKHCIHFPSNQQLMEDFPRLNLTDVTHWRCKCKCKKKRSLDNPRAVYGSKKHKTEAEQRKV